MNEMEIKIYDNNNKWCRNVFVKEKEDFIETLVDAIKQIKVDGGFIHYGYSIYITRYSDKR